MSEFEYLKNMYRRIAEFEDFRNRCKNGSREWNINNSALCALVMSVQDYLELTRK